MNCEHLRSEYRTESRVCGPEEGKSQREDHQSRIDSVYFAEREVGRQVGMAERRSWWIGGEDEVTEKELSPFRTWTSLLISLV